MYDPSRRASNPAAGGTGYVQPGAGGQFPGQGHFSSNAQQRYQMQQQQQSGRAAGMNHSFNQQVSSDMKYIVHGSKNKNDSN